MRSTFDIKRNKGDEGLATTFFNHLQHFCYREFFLGMNTSAEWDTKDCGALRGEGHFIKTSDNEATAGFEERRSSFVARIRFGVKDFAYSPSSSV